jgi:hypothetical protein
MIVVHALTQLPGRLNYQSKRVVRRWAEPQDEGFQRLGD